MPKTEKDDALAVTPAEEKEELAVISEKTEQKKKPEPNPFWRWLRRALGFLLRLVLFLAFLAALVAGVYYGLPILYEKYIRPVETNSSQLTGLTTRLPESETQIVDMETRLAALEAAQTAQAESITDLSARVETLEESIAAHTSTLAMLEEMQSTLQASDEESQAELERQIALLKSMELLSRARLFLYQSNFGLARQDVLFARELLAGIQPGAPEPFDEEIAAALLRLDLVLDNLPFFPVAASDDLNIAWQILLQGIPTQEPETATPEPVSDETSTPTPALEATPTPTP